MTIRSTGARALLPLIVPLLFACRMERTPPPPAEPEPELPTVVGLEANGELNRSRVLEVGRAQKYDINPGSSHRARLDAGAEVTIEPMEGAYRNGKEGFAKGVVLARLVNHSDQAIPRLGLAPGATTYWVFYQKGGQLRSAYIADVESDKFDVRDISVVSHRSTRPWRQAVAQWQLPGILDKSRGMGALGLVAGGELPWVACEQWVCCKPEY